ncbi:hypothetical protein [Stutzerimonas nitrititolerans]|uniref:hypothetical protein n=1 Tax=Stutzerimonas nitrititolerans TaxID=2482751 RepID=UPI0028A1E802|nr:hypothetical protein [Stutzerimonas nitrititolerans]
MSQVNEAVKILSGLIGDICTPIKVIKDYEADPEFQKKNKEIFRQCVYRLCLQALALNMAKYVEFCRKYSKIVNDNAPQHSKPMNLFQEKIKQKEVMGFRNDYVGHIQKDSEKRILTENEIDAYISKIFGNDALIFFKWVWPEGFESKPPESSLVGIIVALRDALRAKL